MTDISEKLEIKQRLDRALKWLEEEPTETATTSAKCKNQSWSTKGGYGPPGPPGPP